MPNTSNPYRQRYHQTDGWRGFTIPARAVAGVSDTGMWDDSPCPSDKVRAELRMLRRELTQAGIHTRVRITQSSNVFMVKRWLVVTNHDDFPKAARLTLDWLARNDEHTDYVHSAYLDTCGYKPNAQVDAEIMAAPAQEQRA